MKLKKIAAAMAIMLGAIAAKADIADGQFSTNQIFDVQYYWSGTTLNASNFIAPYDSTFQHPTVSAGQYFKFFPSTTNPGTYGLGLYNSDGTRAQILHNTGTLQAIGPDALFYIGSGFFGTVITTSAGYTYGQSASFTNMDTSVSSADMTSYTWASTTPLAAGQTASSGGSSSTPSPNYVTVLSNTNITTVRPTSNNSPAGEGASNALDGNSSTKYLNFDRANAGFTIKLDTPRVIRGVTFTTANDFEPRDPSKYSLFGSNDGVNWTTIVDAESITLSSSRYTATSRYDITNNNAYYYYFITFPSIKAIDTYGSISGCQAALGSLACDSVQIGDVTYYYDTTYTAYTVPTDSGTGSIANPGTAGSVSSLSPPGPVAVTNNAGSTGTNPIGTTTLTVTNAGTYTNNGTTGNVTNTGTFTNNGTTGDVTNSGNFENNGTTGSVDNSGTFNNNVGGTTTTVTNNVGGTFNNRGIVTIVTNAGTFTNYASGTTGDFTNSGTMSNSGTVANLTNTGTATNTGSITGTVTNISGTFTNSGTVGGSSVMTTNMTGNVIPGTGLSNSGTTTNSGTIVAVNNSGTLDNLLGGSIGSTYNTGTVNNSGTIYSLYNALNANVTNTGIVTASVTNAGVFTNSGTITGVTNLNGLSSSGRFTNTGTITGEINNNGVFTNDGITAAVNNGGTFTNTGTTGNVNVNSGTFTNSGTVSDVSNEGTFTNSGTTRDVLNAGTFTNTGSITGRFQNDRNYTLINNGSLTTVVNNGLMNHAGSATSVTNNGTLIFTGSGSIGSITNNGIYDISGLVNGSSVATYTQSGTGSTIIDGTKRYSLTGSATLAGNITINNAPTAIGKYTYLTANNITGRFDSQTGTSGRIVYNSTSVGLWVMPSDATVQNQINYIANNMSSMNSLANSSITGSLGSDCTLFGDKGGCISVNYGSSKVGSGDLNSSGLTISKSLNQNWRIGIFGSQQLDNPTLGNIKYESKTPSVGVILGWTSTDNPSLSATFSTVTGNGDYIIGTDKTGIAAKATQIKVSYSTPLNAESVATPYIGLRQSEFKINSYTEQGPIFPLSFASVNQNSTDLLAGVNLSRRLNDKLTGMISLGVVQNINNKIGSVSVTSDMGAFNKTLTGGKYTSSAVGAGLSFELDKNQRLSINTGWQQRSLTDANITSYGINYTVGF